MSVVDFCFQNADTKERDLDYRSLVGHGYVNFKVTQQNLFETFVIFFQIHLLASQLKFVEFA